MSTLIFGAGYLGGRVARHWLAADPSVCIVTRSAEKAREFASQGFAAHVADLGRPETLCGLPAADTVLYAVGYERASSLSRHAVHVDGLRAVADALPGGVRRFLYISSTGVYGQSNGERVDESSECRPTREGGRACLAAERMLEAHALGARAIVLRMAGLYGPGRIPHAAAIRAGRPIAVPRHGFLNLIHVDDAVRIVMAAARRIDPPQRLIVSDGCPVERLEYYRELARLLGAPPPRFDAPPGDTAAAARSAASKRVDNRKLMRILGPRLAYPSYREGLAAIVAENPRLE